jgi:hypothetical protein
MVLWSKDFSNVCHSLGHLENYHLYFQYTINNYPKEIEPQVPDYKETLKILEQLLKTFNPGQFNIRFDPILLQDDPVSNPEKERLSTFTKLCKDLVTLGMTQCRITTSSLALYPHVAHRLAKTGIRLSSRTEGEVTAFFQTMGEIAHKHNLQLYTCASPQLKDCGLPPAACIDGQLLEHLFGAKVSKAKDSGQRSACGCYKSSDIGDYLKPCGFQCVYCYSRGH